MPKKLHCPAVDEVGLFGKEVGVLQRFRQVTGLLQGAGATVDVR